MNFVQCGETTRATRADARRRHILDTARALFVEHGFHRTGVAQIATASGVKVGQIYRDFDSKEDIIAAICEADVASWLEEDALEAAVSARDPAAIRRWIRRFGEIEEPIDECRMMTEIVAEMGRNERIAEINRAVDGRVRKGLEAALEALSPAPCCDRQRARVIDIIMALGAGAMMRRIVDPELDVEALNRHMGELVDRELDRLAR